MQQNEEKQPDVESQPVDTISGEESAPVDGQPAEQENRAEEYLDLLRRTQADFINYRRRAAQEQAEGRAAAQSALIEQLLPALDDLGRALGSAPPDLAGHPWVQGILLVARQLMVTLEQLGVQQIGRPGERFDPRWHEALMVESHPDVPTGTVVKVVRPGYVMGERVIRPAQVVVASAQ